VSRGGLGTPILTYHSLDRSGSVVSVTPEDFARHMEMLHRRGYAAVSLGELVGDWERGAPPDGPKRIGLTFDDGYESVAEHAAPVLARLGFRATVFAVAGRCGGRSDWNSGHGGLPLLPLLSARQLRELAASGVEVGSHGLQHASLETLDGAALEREVVGSKRALEDLLGAEVGVFAYPYGEAGRAARRLVRGSYRAACSTELGDSGPGDDRHWLRRIDVYYHRRPWLFRLLGTRAGAGYVRLRAAGRRLRRALATA